ncbi:MAG: Na+/H+ antiporter subunit E [Desulfurococcaceae archaeon]
MKYTRDLVIFILVFVFYVMLAGILSGLTLFTGLIIAVFMTIITRILIRRGHRGYSLGDLKRIRFMLDYVIKFIYVELVEHIKISRIILSRNMRINPDVVEIPVDLKSRIGLTLLALTITNTPGTIVVDLNEEKGVIYVHLLNRETYEATRIKHLVVGDFEELLRKVVKE